MRAFEFEFETIQHVPVNVCALVERYKLSNRGSMKGSGSMNATLAPGFASSSVASLTSISEWPGTQGRTSLFLLWGKDPKSV